MELRKKLSNFDKKILCNTARRSKQKKSEFIIVKSTPDEVKDVTIVNVASILGLFNVQQPKGWAYNTSKSAVVTASRCISGNEKQKNFRMVRGIHKLR